MVIGSNQVMERSNLVSRFTNEDYDGDSLIALALHSEQAREDFKYAYVRNQIAFEHMDELLIDYEHESIYSSYMLTLTSQKNPSKIKGDTISLFDLDIGMEDLSTHSGNIHQFDEFKEGLNLAEAAINKILLEPIYKIDPSLIQEPIYFIERDGLLNKKNLMKLTTRYFELLSNINVKYQKEVINFWDTIHEFDKLLLECSGSLSTCSPSFDLKDFVVQSPEITEFKEELISVEPFIAFHQNLVLFEKISDEISKNPDNILNLVFQSGARLKSVQLLKAASNTGIPTDIYGKAFPANIKNSLLDGLTPEEYFITGDSARLALAVRQEAIPKGGELQRKFFFSTGILKTAPEIEDCGTEKYYTIKVSNKDHLRLLNHRWHWTEKDGLQKVDINDKSLIGNNINLRSPMTCKCPDYRICKKCFGDKQPESINLGSTVGAALSEGIIQSVLRTHHFGGAFIATEDKHLMEIMRRSEFKAPDTIYCTNEDSKYLVDYLNKIYPEDNDAEFIIDQIDPKTKEPLKYSEELSKEELVDVINNIPDDSPVRFKMIINELPFNDDSVKQLNNIVSLIDKNRDAGGLIDPSVLYEKLQIVIEQNNILSVYLELIISLLYYDEDNVLYRYSAKEPSSQIALKNIVEVLDPKLSIFYNFSNRIISKIYNHTSVGHIDHMYHDLLECYR